MTLPRGGRTVLRPSRNASTALPQVSRPLRTDAQQVSSHEHQLGFAPLPILDHWRLASQGTQPLSASAGEAKGANEQQRDAPSRAAGPLKAAVDRFSAQRASLQSYVTFDRGEPTVAKDKAAGQGLFEPEQHQALCNLVVEELAQAEPRDVSQIEREAFAHSAQSLATALVNRALMQSDGQLRLRVLMGILSQVRTLYGRPASELDAETVKSMEAAKGDGSIGGDKPTTNAVVQKAPQPGHPSETPAILLEWAQAAHTARTPGPMTAAVHALKPNSKNKQHYITFKDGQLALLQKRPAGLGLAKPDQAKAFVNLVLAELLHLEPAGVSPGESKAFEDSARVAAKGLVNRTLKQIGSHAILGGLMAMLEELPELAKLCQSRASHLTSTSAQPAIQASSKPKGRQVMAEGTGTVVS
jgi:hypothetical protein